MLLFGFFIFCQALLSSRLRTQLHCKSVLLTVCMCVCVHEVKNIICKLDSCFFSQCWCTVVHLFSREILEREADFCLMIYSISYLLAPIIVCWCTSLSQRCLQLMLYIEQPNKYMSKSCSRSAFFPIMSKLSSKYTSACH